MGFSKSTAWNRIHAHKNYIVLGVLWETGRVGTPNGVIRELIGKLMLYCINVGSIVWVSFFYIGSLGMTQFMQYVFFFRILSHPPWTHKKDTHLLHNSIITDNELLHYTIFIYNLLWQFIKSKCILLILSTCNMIKPVIIPVISEIYACICSSSQYTTRS